MNKTAYEVSTLQVVAILIETTRRFIDCFFVLAQAMALSAAALEELPNITIPFKCIHGADDTITYPAGSELIISRSGTSDEEKSLEMFPGLRHEVRAIS